jgi:NAD(P)-dependent dehydrogenase (short-subunit alcohol dehydrogenase family)
VASCLCGCIYTCGRMLDLTGKVAVVTGAGSIGPGWGNGKATAVLLARQGAKVFGIDVNAEAAAVTGALIEKEGGTAVAHCCDMLVSQEVHAAMDTCLDHFGRIDILVNNVGGSAPGDPVSMTEEVWDAQIDLNLKTAFLGCKYVLPAMERQGAGAIVNIASIAGLRHHVAARTYAAYSAAKAGMIALGKATALAYVKKGVRCNTVVVGTMHTPLVEARVVHQIGGGDIEALIAKRERGIPMGRMGDAWDVAHAVLFLASDEARYITATELVVDGGISAARP